MTKHVLSLIEMVRINDIEANQRGEKQNKKEISLTFQIFLLDRNEVILRLNGNFCLSLLFLKLVFWDKNSNNLTMVSFKALEEISATSHTVLRFFSYTKDSRTLTFVSSQFQKGSQYTVYA